MTLKSDLICKDLNRISGIYEKSMLNLDKTETGLESSLIYDPDESDGSDSIHSGDEIAFNDLPDDFLDRLIPSNLDGGLAWRADRH